MNDEGKKKIALFRYGVIADLITKSFTEAS